MVSFHILLISSEAPGFHPKKKGGGVLEPSPPSQIKWAQEGKTNKKLKTL